MDGTDADVLERMRDNAGSFERMQDTSDIKLNDGNNYKGLMTMDDYKKKRGEVIGGEALEAEKKAERIANLRAEDRDARTADASAREERERVRREKLKRELAAASSEGGGAADEDADGGAEDGGGAAKKKKKKKAKKDGPALSFDADEEG